MAVEAIRTTGKKTVQGRVISDKMDKTIVVLVEGRQVHPLYRKYVNFSKKVKAHDEKNEAGIGDMVRVVEARPISRDKHWRLVEIIERAR
ncbi:MAG: 30S ribosomal protein S17 [Spirochaetaceae bacterium]|nr:MAG: 30S ribosomal protein S17 [Spirochaetaceae bacterium]